MSRLRRAVAVVTTALLSSGALAALAPDALADAPITVYVDPAGGGSDHDGCAGSANACATIGYALGAVAPGGSVIVQPGTYDESPDITQQVTLVGNGAVVNSLTIGDAAGDVEVRGFSVASTSTPLVTISDHTPGVRISFHDNTLDGGAAPQTAVEVNDNSADVSISNDTIRGTTTGVDLIGTAPGAYAVNDNSFAITDGTGAAVALTAPGAADTLTATVGGNTGTVSPTGRTITQAGPGTISVSTGSPNRLHADGTSVSVPDAPTTLTTLETPTAFAATVSSGTTLSNAALDVVVSAPAGTTANELTLGANLDGGSGYTDVALLGTGPFHARIADLPGLAPNNDALVHLRLAALDGAAAGALSLALDLDEAGAAGAVLNTATTTSLSVQTVVNSPPTATAQSISVARNGATDITLDATPTDNDPITAWTHTAVAHGTLTPTDDQHLHYTPDTGYSGPDSFTYTATDRAGVSSAAEVDIAVTADHAPQANSVTERIDHGAKNVPIDLSGSVSDLDHDRLTFAVDTAAAHGSATVDAATGVASYTPAADFGGADTFTYTVNDGSQDSRPATVTVSVDSAPTVTVAPQAPHAPLGGSTQLQLVGNDVDGDRLGYWVGTPTYGSVRRSGTLLTYTAPTDWAGRATFPFSAKDGHGGKATGTAEVIVDRAATALRLSISPKRPTAAQHPSLTVRVSSAGNPDGLVTVGNTTTRARHGIATFSLSTYAGGVHTVSAAFRGTLTAGPVDRATTSFTVTRVASSLTVTTDPLQLTTTTKNATATVRVGAGSLTASSGVVTIDENGHRLASGSVRGGSVTVHLPRFTLGQHNLTVAYTGTDRIAPSSIVQVERVSLGR